MLVNVLIVTRDKFNRGVNASIYTTNLVVSAISLSEPIDLRRIRGKTVLKTLLVDVTEEEFKTESPEQYELIRRAMLSSGGTFEELKSPKLFQDNLEYKG